MDDYQRRMVQQLKSMVAGAYALQNSRIQAGNRIAANFKAKVVAEISSPEDTGIQQGKNEREAQRIIGQLTKDYELIAEAIAGKRLRVFQGQGLIDSQTEFNLMKEYMALLSIERESFKNIGKVLPAFPIYTEFLEHVVGIGPAMAGVIIAYLDIDKARYPSSFFKFAGIDVAEDGRGRGRYAEHLVLREYRDREGNIKEKRGITYQPFLKSKLLQVLAGSFIKCKNPKYAAIYADAKHRELSKNPPEGGQPITNLHAHRRAVRKMVKQFLIDLHIAWSLVEGRPIQPPYHEAKLGVAHKGKPSGDLENLYAGTKRNTV